MDLRQRVYIRSMLDFINLITSFKELLLILFLPLKMEYHYLQTNWPKDDFDRLKSYAAQLYHSPKPLAVSRDHGVVSGTTHSLAVHAGIFALQQGGNAMDACVATALTGNCQLNSGNFMITYMR